MTFAARLLIRFATLVPDAIDLRATGRDIEALAAVLQRGPGPGAMLADQIQAVLRRARSKRVLPPRSRPGSPRRADGLSGMTALGDGADGGHGNGNGHAHGHGQGQGQGHGHGGMMLSVGHSAVGEREEGHVDLGNVGFEFLNDFSFPEDLFNGNSLNDDDVSQRWEGADDRQRISSSGSGRPTRPRRDRCRTTGRREMSYHRILGAATETTHLPIITLIRRLLREPSTLTHLPGYLLM